MCYFFDNEHTYYETCPYCGANLDPGETCDCLSIPNDEHYREVDTDENIKEDKD